MIDPPSGWMFGFPKPIPDGVKDINKWLVEQGYPQKLIDDYGDYFYCRYWNEPKEGTYDHLEAKGRARGK